MWKSEYKMSPLGGFAGSPSIPLLFSLLIFSPCFNSSLLVLCSLAAAACWWSSLDPKGQLRQRQQPQPKPTHPFQQPPPGLFSLSSHLDCFFFVLFFFFVLICIRTALQSQSPPAKPASPVGTSTDLPVCPWEHPLSANTLNGTHNHSGGSVIERRPPEDVCPPPQVKSAPSPS